VRFDYLTFPHFHFSLFQLSIQFPTFQLSGFLTFQLFFEIFSLFEFFVSWDFDFSTFQLIAHQLSNFLISNFSTFHVFSFLTFQLNDVSTILTFQCFNFTFLWNFFFWILNILTVWFFNFFTFHLLDFSFWLFDF
jgi:hypothetical protein